MFLGVMYKLVDTPETKIARFAIYKLPSLILIYSHDYSCRKFYNAIVLKVF